MDRIELTDEVLDTLGVPKLVEVVDKTLERLSLSSSRFSLLVLSEIENTSCMADIPSIDLGKYLP